MRGRTRVHAARGTIFTEASGATRIRAFTTADLDASFRIETASFPPTEAASRDKIARRIERFPQGFLVAAVDGHVVGHINSGVTDRDDITDEALKELAGHDPEGTNVVVFSLAVVPEFRRRGIASALMRAFIAQSRRLGKQRVMLLCKDDVIGFYE